VLTSRAIRPALLLAVISVLAGGCARIQSPAPSTTPGSPNPATAIVLSVLADSIYLVDPESGQRQAVRTGLAHYQAGWAVWSPDRWRLAYANDGIFLMDPRTGRQWTLDRGANLSMPAWSPDGRSIVYGDGVSLWVSEVEPFDPVPVHVRATLAPLGMSWNPGGAIVFEGLRRDCTRSFRCTSTDESEVWTIQPDGTGLTKLTSFGRVQTPRWSPDGRRLLVIRRTDGGETRELWVIEANGSGAQRVLDAGDVIAADWSPSGDRLALVRTVGSGGTLQVWTASVDGSGARPIGSPVPGDEATIDW
jgi:dipeptidyl aminopeptidase/acylaminoacyl peptidase